MDGPGSGKPAVTTQDRGPILKAVRAGDYRYFDTRFMALAHRGGALLPANLGRENTLHAFAQAEALGYRYVETDVHATRDGHLVAMHDHSLDRVTGTSGLVAHVCLRELDDVRVGGADPIPTLAQVLEEFPRLRFNIDLKSDLAVEPLAALLRSLHAEERVCVGSFSARRLRRFRALAGPSVATSVGPWGVIVEAYAPLVRRLNATPGVALQIPRRIWRNRMPLLNPGLIGAAHRAGRVVHVWTVDAADEMHRLIDAGVDGIVTDRPDVLKDVLIDRDLWDGTS